MTIRELLFGRPLRTDEQEAHTIGPLAGVPVLGLDALASASYGPEAALTVLLPLGAAATGYIGPLSAVIIGLLLIVYLSYRQTISAYQDGGGSYSVASRNLGARAGLLAAAALALDYILNAAVAISAGVGAIISAVPALQPHTLLLCLVLLALLTLVNLRGVREAGLVFMLPTYLFVGLLGVAIVVGLTRSFASGGHPVPLSPPHHATAVAATAAGTASLWRLLHAFAGGCTAMTGVEAVSNGVPLFREPRVRGAQRTLTIIIIALAGLLAGIAVLCRAYGITATEPGGAGYESVLSQMVRAVMGEGLFYYATIAAVVSVLALSANTSFAGFPRLCRVLALDEYLPAGFAHLGRRLVYSSGITILALLAAILLIVFGGVTDRLIPLFAVGAFLAFTLSQWGMVAHWRREGGHAASLAINGIGAVATAVTLVVILAAKFTEGAWLTVIFVPAVFYLFLRVRAHHDAVDEETEVRGPLQLDEPPPPVVVVPLKRLDRVARKALRLAVSMSPEVHVLHVRMQEPNVDPLRERWTDLVARPLTDAGYPAPRLVEIPSVYREFLSPVLDYVYRLSVEHPRRYVAVIVPELIEQRWYQRIIHSHRAALLRMLLLWRGGPRVIVVSTPWHLRDQDDD